MTSLLNKDRRRKHSYPPPGRTVFKIDQPGVEFSLVSTCRLLASCAPYGFVEVTAAQSPRPSSFLGLLVCHFFLIYPCLLFFSSFASSSCTSVPSSVVSKCMLEKCLFACCKTCFDKYQLQVNDTVYEHWRFSLPFSFHEGGGTNETSSSFFLSLFPTYTSYRSIFFLFQALCTHYALLKAFMTNVTADRTSFRSVLLNMGHAQNFCASPARDNSQSLAHRYCRRAGIASCLNLSAKQQSNIMFPFFSTDISQLKKPLSQIWSGWNVHSAPQCLVYVLVLSAKTVQIY